ncbi:prepilin-type N-terminal cleavage/methylation domain-containing protein [candidate division WOR-3 bacterium]|nr:prepilin-type N-terminal cleavage/methylation domain-containing protein [candidate division WOR-3 bacterium]
MRNNKGFTLIELMIVVIILGVLAAILIPRFMGAQDDARTNAAIADISLVREGLGLFFVYEGHFPNVATYAALRDTIRRHVTPPVDSQTFTDLDYDWITASEYDIDAKVIKVAGPRYIHANEDTIYWDGLPD